MKPMANDLGMCGIEQMFYAGKVAYNTTGIGTGVALFEAPQKMIITKVVAVVGHAFNAGTTNVLVLGTEDDDDAIAASGSIDESSATAQFVNAFVELEKGDKVLAKYTSTGTEPSAGDAEFYVFAVGVPA